MIELRDLGLRVGERRLLDGVRAFVTAGEFLAVVGPNGAGKTTLLRAIAGLHPPAAGTVTVDGAALAALSPVQRALRVGFVTSDDVLPDALRVRDVVAIGRYPHHRWWEWQPRPHDEEVVEGALAAVAMGEFSQRLFSTLSSGERQRVWIALGLAQETPVLLLDEPTSHLDVRVAHEILALLRRLADAGKTIVCVLHDLNDAAAYADRLALLGRGALLALDRADDVLAGEAIETAYGLPLERVRSADGRLRVFARAVRLPSITP
ncbi:MAG TPA: ABC transporter ATP-binding protein [Candidatus Acidoferrales bacterium]|nr:ABC transporter ATP-binding protein [Candidatus Acidoferrales bacterium]